MKRLLLLLMSFSFVGTVSANDQSSLEITQNHFYHHLAVITGNSEVLNIEDRYTRASKSRVREYFRDVFDSSRSGSDQYYEINFDIPENHFEVRNAEYNEEITTGVNVVIEIPGAKYPDEIVMVTAHYDSVEGTQGANDNGTGTAGVLTLAENLLQMETRPERTIRLVLFDLEEQGLVGSRDYFKTAAERGDDIKLVLNMDMIGHSPEGMEPILAYSGGTFQNTVGPFLEEVLLGQETPLLLDSSVFQGHIIDPEKNLSSRHYYRENYARRNFRFSSSDALSALQNGFPSVTLIENSTGWSYYSELEDPKAKLERFYPYYHKPEDSIEKLNTEFSAMVVEFVKSAILRSANSRETFDTHASKIWRERLYREACEAALR